MRGFVSGAGATFCVFSSLGTRTTLKSGGTEVTGFSVIDRDTLLSTMESLTSIKQWANISGAIGEHGDSYQHPNSVLTKKIIFWPFFGTPISSWTTTSVPRAKLPKLPCFGIPVLKLVCFLSFFASKHPFSMCLVMGGMCEYTTTSWRWKVYSGLSRNVLRYCIYWYVWQL